MAENFDRIASKFNDSVYSSCLVKADETPTEIDGKSTALNFFRCLESLNKFIHESDGFSEETLACSSCCDQLVKTIEKVYKQTQEQARSYSATIHEYQTEYNDQNVFEDDEDYDGKDDHSEPYSISQQSECELDLQRHLKDIEDERLTTASEIEKELALIASFETSVAALDTEIRVLGNHSDRAIRELNFLSKQGGCLSVLFDLNMSSRLPPSTSSSTSKSTCPTSSSDDGREVVPVINGMRLMYLPSHAENLNWAEINQAWCCLSLLVCCLRNRGSLTEKAFIVIESEPTDSDVASGSSTSEASSIRISIQLRPLRRRTLILLSLDSIGAPPESSSAEEVLFLCGEGSSKIYSDSSNSFKDNAQDEDEAEADDFLGVCFSRLPNARHQRIQYYKAVVALAAVVCATARDLSRMDCLTESMRLLDLEPLLRSNSNRNGYQRCVSEHPESFQVELCRSVMNLMAVF